MTATKLVRKLVRKVSSDLQAELSLVETLIAPPIKQDATPAELSMQLGDVAYQRWVSRVSACLTLMLSGTGMFNLSGEQLAKIKNEIELVKQAMRRHAFVHEQMDCGLFYSAVLMARWKDALGSGLTGTDKRWVDGLDGVDRCKDACTNAYM